MTRVTRFFTPFFLTALLLAAGFGFFSMAQAQAPEDVRYYTAEWGRDIVHTEHWDAGDELTVLVVEFEQDGQFLLFGSAITAPVSIDGEVISTTVIPDEIAVHFTHTRIVQAGEQMVIEITPNEPGSDLWIYYHYQEAPNTECLTETFSVEAENPIVFDWDNYQDVLCAQVTAETTGTLAITGGWVFDPPITMNGKDMQTHYEPGQLAAQIDPITMTVSAGETFTIAVSLAPGNTAQLGIFYELTPSAPPEDPVYYQYLSIVFGPEEQPPATLTYTETLTVSDELQVMEANWPNAEADQSVCYVLETDGQATTMVIESGWSFGQVLELFVDGMSTPLAFTPNTDPEVAGQIGNAELVVENNIKVCTTDTTPGNDIGLRIRYPSGN